MGFENLLLNENGYPNAPNCGACPGDGSVCPSTCKVMEDSPPIMMHIKDRLRAYVDSEGGWLSGLDAAEITEAADHIESLESRIALLESEAEQLRMSVHNARIALVESGNNAWISVKVQLPKERGAYLVYHPSYPETIRIVNFGTSTKWENGRDKIRKSENRITHWKTLPGAPTTKDAA